MSSKHKKISAGNSVQNRIGIRVEIGILNISTLGPINDGNLILYGIFVMRGGLCGRKRRTLAVFLWSISETYTQAKVWIEYWNA
jgi:hypothetical protein